MQFEEGYIYHIYNQGNNRRRIFFNRENYLYFLRKVKKYITPYGDILAWCLMPNHFHLMVLVNKLEVPISEQVTISHPLTTNTNRTLNNSIAIILRSYTRAINKQENSSGSLFRKETKAECVNCPKGIVPSFITKAGITQINIVQPEKQYPKICFDYIHRNPAKANLVKKDTDWEFSSAKDYAGLRKGKIINIQTAKKYGLI